MTPLPLPIFAILAVIALLFFPACQTGKPGDSLDVFVAVAVRNQRAVDSANEILTSLQMDKIWRAFERYFQPLKSLHFSIFNTQIRRNQIPLVQGALDAAAKRLKPAQVRIYGVKSTAKTLYGAPKGGSAKALTNIHTVVGEEFGKKGFKSIRTESYNPHMTLLSITDRPAKAGKKLLAKYTKERKRQDFGKEPVKGKYARITGSYHTQLANILVLYVFAYGKDASQPLGYEELARANLGRR